MILSKMRLEQNDRYFTDDIYVSFVVQKVRISILISQKSLYNGPVYNNWREPMTIPINYAYTHHQVWMDINISTFFQWDAHN